MECLKRAKHCKAFEVFSIHWLIPATIILVHIINPTSALAQNGAIHGTIRDSETGESLIGANVILEETSFGAASDLDGKYRLQNVPPGTYTLKISYVGYAASKITDVTLKASQSLKLDINLQSETYTTEEVVVTAERVLSTESALLAARRKSGNIGDAISIEQVKRSPDATSADALKRVTGVTIMDNKFVFVRGVTDRYNGATLNGIPVTSTDTDVDKKSFAFDMIPSNLLTNLTVVKTATPDLPGDFTGGLVQVNTLEFPEKRTLKVSISSSMNSITTGDNFVNAYTSGTDWLGFDDGARTFPDGITDTQYELPQKLQNNWGLSNANAPISGAFNLSAGDRFTIYDQNFGYVGALSYRTTNAHRVDTAKYYQGGSLLRDAQGDVYTSGVLWGALMNLSYQISDNHKVKFSNNFNQSAEQSVGSSRVIDENNARDSVLINEWDQRTTYIGNIGGEHYFFFANGLKLDWQASYTSSISNEPDRKTFVTSKDNSQSISFPYLFESAERSWSRLAEFNRTAGFNIEGNPVTNLKMKTGIHHETKNRSYQIEFYQVDKRNVRDSLLLHPIDEIFSHEYFVPGRFFMNKLSDARDTYTGEQALWAGYLMGDYRLTILEQQFRVVGGLRLENSEIYVNTISPYSTNEPYVAAKLNNDWLPSFNFTYLVTDDVNFRMAYGKSVNRPEFRELSSFYFYDYNEYEGTFGNPELVRAIAENYDARMEWFPGVGEVLAVSYFLKTIRDPIEQKILPSSNPERTWFNSDFGKNAGWEFEVRKNFAFIHPYGENFMVYGNYTRVFSEINYVFGYKDPDGSGRDIFETRQREMQGQSPWMINAGFTFHEPTIGTTVNILYNQYGDRLSAVGDERDLDIYEISRPVIDLSVTQPFLNSFEAKFTIKDMGAEYKRYRTRNGEPYRAIFSGTSYGLSVSYGM